MKGDEALLEVATEYFKDLFDSKLVGPCDTLMRSIQPCVRQSTNEELCSNFKEEDILEALKAMVPLKASGKDEFPAFFVQKFWHIVGPDVTSYCLDILNNRRDMKMINNTTIVLIPKIQNPRNMG